MATAPPLTSTESVDVHALEREAAAILADTLAAERAAVQAAGGSTEDIDWRPRLDELFAEHPDDLTVAASR